MGFLDAYSTQGSGDPGQGLSQNSVLSNGWQPESLLGSSGLGTGPANNMLGMGNPTPGGLAAPTTFSKIGGVLGSKGFASGMGAFSQLASAYTGFKSLGLAKKQLNFQKNSFNKNFGASAKAYNNQLKDRWEARNNASNARGQTYEGRDSWLSGRTIDEGTGNRSNSSNDQVPGRSNAPPAQPEDERNRRNGG